jgi:hypothetical protein
VLSEAFPTPSVLPARESSRTEEVSTGARASRTETGYFGWFGKFMAFTGANLLTLTIAAMGALFVGAGAVLAARRRQRRTQALSGATP